MPLKLDIEQGSEYLLPYAKQVLRQLKDLARVLKQPFMQKQTMGDDGAHIAVNTLTVAPGAELDAIRITGATWLAISPSMDVVATDGLDFYNLQRVVRNIPDSVETAALNSRERTRAVRQTPGRVVYQEQCYVRGQFFFTEVVDSTDLPVTDPPTAYEAGSYLAIMNGAGDILQYTHLADVGDGEPFAATRTAFTFVTDNNAWAATYLRGGGDQGDDDPVFRCITLDLDGAVFTVDPEDVVTGGLGEVQSDDLGIFPIGIRDDAPYFLVTGKRQVSPVYNVVLVYQSGTTDLMALTGVVGGPPAQTVGIKNFGHGGSILKINEDETTEEHVEVFFTVQIGFFPTIQTTVYGYSTDTGLQIIDDQTWDVATSGTTTALAYPSNEHEPRGQLSLRDKKSGLCVYHDGHIRVPIIRSVYSGGVQTGTQFCMGSMTGVAYASTVTLAYDVYTAPLVTNDECAFAVFLTTNLSEVDYNLRIIDSTGVVRVSEDDVEDIVGFLGLGGSSRLPFRVDRHIILYEQGEIVIFFERRARPVDPSPDYTHIRQVIKVMAGTITDVGTRPQSSSQILGDTFNDGVVVGGRAYAYALAEDTPDTEEGTALRLRTFAPGSDKLYRVLVNSDGEIVHTIQVDPLEETLDATEPTYPAVQNQFTIWNNEGE